MRPILFHGSLGVEDAVFSSVIQPYKKLTERDLTDLFSFGSSWRILPYPIIFIELFFSVFYFILCQIARKIRALLSLIVKKADGMTQRLIKPFF